MLAHHGLGAVIEQLARHPAKVPERRPVTGPERHQILGAGHGAERVARMAEHHVKAVERQLQPRARAERLLVRPIDLRLMARRRLKPLLALGRRPGPGPLHVAAHRVVAALEAVVAHQVLMDPRRQQPRLRGQPLIDPRLERIQLGRRAPAAIDRLHAVFQITLDRPPIAPHQPRDLGIAVPLTPKRPDVHQLLLADQCGLRARRQRTPRASRPPPTEPAARPQQPRPRASGSSPLRGSSPLTRTPNPSSQTTYRIR
jgi:hypothetical protein